MISQGLASGTHLRIRHASPFSHNGGEDNPVLDLEQADAFGAVSHRGTIQLDYADDDIHIKNSDSDGGVAFYNNNTTLLGRLDSNGFDLASGLDFKKNGAALNSLTTGAQTIQGVKTFPDKPVFVNGIQSDDFTTLGCLLYTSPSPRDGLLSRMPSSA